MELEKTVEISFLGIAVHKNEHWEWSVGEILD